ncbi:MAG TPA: hypothetical protein DEG17_17125 [Cyanobacteria bacterium UBA11149]|nr:hypothetical protein [Cyanobacteria bacterium UBA11367]HBE58032.1 hypothetical protein [Cyanobacteria bacterium UBA11366]HBK66263.1 hypothetical protein [Cyanobacteria bacterium UBA11166]HBR72423.1 hypothetical protein [Cyanobacteria bacterium UBA11159]HBS71952.1 hypothetical protein [Cyanobacteria bacterium UBA11153]HBW90544.1 hypothetical protein [Cyanobacteria bacterium UBA11149]HCA93933.1 hypothetical protein [Cyanobacteria bacterium UBA9226]
MQTPTTKQIPKINHKSLYDTDFYAWIHQQAKFLKHQEWKQIP